MLASLPLELHSSWTHFLEGGDGTVDGGHQCLAGRKRVIMLRRLNKADKRRAMKILAGDLNCREDEDEQLGGRGGGVEDPLCKSPDDSGRKIPWPSEEAINLLKEVSIVV